MWGHDGLGCEKSARLKEVIGLRNAPRRFNSEPFVFLIPKTNGKAPWLNGGVQISWIATDRNGNPGRGLSMFGEATVNHKTPDVIRQRQEADF